MSVIFGDASQEIVLEATKIKDATLLILTIPDLVATRSTIVQAKRLNGRLKIVARALRTGLFRCNERSRGFGSCSSRVRGKS